MAMWLKARPAGGGSSFNFAFVDASGNWAINADPQNTLGIRADGGALRAPPFPVVINSTLQIPYDGNFHHVVVRWGSDVCFGTPAGGCVTFTLDSATSSTIFVPYEYWRFQFPLTFSVVASDACLDELVMVDGLLTDAQIAQLQTRPYDFLNSTPVALCRNVTVTTNSSCQASITTSDINDGSSDPQEGTNVFLSLDSYGPFGVGQHDVTLTVTDSNGASDSCTATVNVTNPAPIASITTPASGSIFPVNTEVSFTGSVTDNPADSHSAQWMFDNITQPGTVNESGGIVSATYAFATPGVYAVKLTVTDGCGGFDNADQIDGVPAIVVIYDPNGGFVTGGGWFISPAGAYTVNPSATGRANFGFVSKYVKGATVPSGETEFQFQTANFNFHSTSYEWLVIGGAKAQYKGSGTINGSGSYGFILTAIDGQVNGGGGADRFRLKIWDKVNGDPIIYDNQIGGSDSADPTTVLRDGSIVVHR
jgi:hypothetical protein